MPEKVHVEGCSAGPDFDGPLRGERSRGAPDPSATGMAPQKGFRRFATSPALVLVLATVLGAALRLVRLGSKPFWSAELQEIFNARCDAALSNIRDSGSDILGFLWHNVVYRLDLQPLEWWSRLPSALVGTMAVPVAWYWGRRFLGPGAAAVAAILAAGSVFLVDLSQTARLYMAVAVAGNAGTLLLLAWLERLGACREAVRLEGSAISARCRSNDTLLHGAGTIPSGCRPASGRAGGWGLLAAFWLCDCVAVLGHAMGLLFLVVQGGAYLFVRRRELLGRPLAEAGRMALLALPLAPAIALQLHVTLAFQAKLVYHQDVFLVGRGYGPVSLAESILLALSGAWTPFWLVFLFLLLLGARSLYLANRQGAFVAGLSLLVPLVFVLSLLGVAGANAFDITFSCLLFAPVFLLAGGGITSIQSTLKAHRPIALASVALLVGVFLFTNARLLARYYAAPVRPVLGADFASPSRLLEALSPSQEDLLVFRYDEQFTHLAFHAAQQLQQVPLVAEHAPPHSAARLAEYLHRLNGCADRPRVASEQVRPLVSLKGDARVAGGRLFLVLTCLPRYPEPFGDPNLVSPSRVVPDYAAWILSAGAVQDTCIEVASLLSGFEVYVFSGAILAVKEAAGRTMDDLHRELSALFRRMPPTRLRLHPVEG
ncbi:MAG: hypothetical protein FJ109_06595 [Deltaproteobacteria bacterium]|nr:hypothetical protein [Deltaproteobacteria bacterium]